MGSSGSTPIDGAGSGFGRLLHLDVNHATPPTAAYVSIDDTLYILTATDAVNNLAIVSARLLMPNGDIKPSTWTVKMNHGRNAFYTPIPLPECFILSVSITTQANSVGRDNFCQAIISRGQPNIGVISQVLCSGYPSNTLAISWPSGVSTDNVNCAGNINSITGTMPAAGSEIHEVVPANAKWRLMSIRFTLNTNATVATRIPSLLFTDPVSIFAQSTPNFNVPASGNITFTFAAGYAGTLVNNPVVCAQLPTPMFLMPGFVIATATTFLQSGDQYSAPQYLVEEWYLP